MGTSKEVKAVELIFDWNLWPRHKSEVLDATNLNQLRDALRDGLRFPPIVIGDDMRIVDGFHRTKAVLDVFGEENGKISAEVRHYESDNEMYLEAGALNNHGLKLSPLDRAHFIITARKRKIPPIKIAVALGMDPERMKEFIKKRSATTVNGHTIALPGGARNLAGKKLTEAQEHFVRTTGGCIPEMYARMLLNALNANVLPLTDKTMNLMKELHNKLGLFIKEAS